MYGSPTKESILELVEAQNEVNSALKDRCDLLSAALLELRETVAVLTRQVDSLTDSEDE